MRNRRLSELVGLLLLVCATLVFLALVSYNPADASLNTIGMHGRRPGNFVGPAGAYTADLLFQLLGLPAFLLPIATGMWAMSWVRPELQRNATPLKWRIVGVALCVLAACTLLGQMPRHLHWRSAIPIQGLAGTLLASFFVNVFNPIGAAIVTLTALMIGLYLSTTFSLSESLTHARVIVEEKLAFLVRPFIGPWKAVQQWRQQRLARQQARRSERQTRIEQHKADRAKRAAVVPAAPAAQLAPVSTKHTQSGTVTAEPRRPAPVREPVSRQEAAAGPTRFDRQLASNIVEEPPLEDVVVTPMVERTPPAKTPRQRVVGGYKLPASSLLQEPGEGERVDEDELRRQAAVLRSKCEEFDVRGQVTQINPGPVVTTYEFKPEAGIKYNKVTSLAEDLCLALEAESVFIERIPGKSTVGIEVPNRRRETILLREVVESEEFHNSRSCLTMALGKDINGHIVTSDLAAMPHLLIAGSTGSGKSVALNSVIVSMLYKSTPDELRLILVDPKRLELGLYDGIPHLYTPIITEPKLAANALRNAVREMERRLKLLASKGVRNIAQFNRLFEGKTPGLFDNLEENPDDRPIPYIVIIIDELADLMIVDASNVEESITRLAQMARAVGIHLILATQRPSVDVITGLIKANFPARMSFRVATKIDSRTILDVMGAEQLLGKGDMLFLPPGTSRLHRVHGAYLTEKEIAAVVEFWSKQAQPQFDESFLKPPQEEGAAESEAGGPAEGDEHDPLFEDAVRVVLEYGKASTSLLQRRLRIGYGRAAHLIDLMYNDGLVGPADGPKPREVLKRPDWLTEVDEVLR